MDYFVNIEHLPYYQWQAELLLESFKQHNLDESLVVGLSLTNVVLKDEFCRNLMQHPRIHGVNNIGEVRGYDRLNELYSLATTLRMGIMKQPFVLIKPDCVLYKPVVVESNEYPRFTFQVDPFFTRDLVEENIPNFGNYVTTDSWTPLSGTYHFDKLPLEFFDRAAYLAEMLAYEQAKENKEIWRHTDRAAWAVAALELVGKVVIEGQYTFEMTPSDDAQHNFITYGRGCAPYFSKSHFQYTPPAMLSIGGDPFDALAHLPEQIGSTSSAEYIADLARRCLDARQ